ncbi:prolipoprotein diacylglyceryl transferase [Rhizobiaceae bacterium BDR2-2]|uniref:Phosphatidylglycerol--prolipoprotein diacylglyceryl transferase n=1 Tax=Ectorhizobium quercum TaxID=2965071 RepID=A0AAE3MYT5_9HYPH|nr:prolipoprotein diacylglyceryl transferase [Ectorhizobium quercum]MCX8996569.1 prolipoprotein diacylglyceryl transferase [Ectorhizobium quercum]
MQSAAAFLAILPYPEIDPIALSIGPLAIRWYGLAYVAGIMLGWLYARSLVAKAHLWPGGTAPATRAQIDDFVVWATLGIVLGGRIGYILFYDPAPVLENPLSAFAVWNGGMSFHGGFLGATLAMILFARRHGIRIWSLFDVVAAVAPIGLFFGRIANFINGELWGRISDVPWAMVFPTGGPFTRHPSQLYEAALEGLATFLVLFAATRFTGILKKPGFTAGLFVSLYAASRIFVEFFREPDEQIGYLAGNWLTMGMILSLPMLAAGIWAMARAKHSA